MAYVYRHIRLDTNVPFYIGISKRDDKNYARAYCKTQKHRNRFWLSVTAKTEYEVEILFENVSYDFAKQKEIEFIELYKMRRDGGTLTNLTKGGDGVLGLKNPKLSERNKKGVWLGKKHSLESRLRISAGNKGKVFKESSRKLLSEKAKIRNIGDNNPNYKGVVYIYHNQKIIYYANGLLDAAKFIGHSVEGNIHAYLSTRKMHQNGYVFTRFNWFSVDWKKSVISILNSDNLMFKKIRIS